MGRKKHSVGIIIAAGGSGKRLGGTTPKQFLPLGGIPILRRTVETFAQLPEVDEIVVVAPRTSMRRVEQLLRGLRSNALLGIAEGGKERQDSVWNGLHAFVTPPGLVLVHDAVRPMVEVSAIREVIAAVVRYGAAVVGTPVKDTIKVEGKKGFYSRTLDRSRLWAVQTPQGFRYSLLLDAHRKARRARFLGTDEASLVERLKVPVRIVSGEGSNLKITTREDLQLAEFQLKREFRIRR